MKVPRTESRSFESQITKGHKSEASHGMRKLMDIHGSLKKGLVAVMFTVIFTVGTIGAFVGCAPRSLGGGNQVASPQISENESFTSAATDQSIEVADGMMASPSTDAFATVSYGESRILLSPDRDGFGIELLDGANQNQVRITAPGGSPIDYDVTELSGPARIVVDLKGKTGSPTRVFDVADSGLVSKIRIGSHPDKSRLVLDLVPGVAIEHSVTQEHPESGSPIIVTLKGPPTLDATENGPAHEVIDQSAAIDSTPQLSDIETAELSEPYDVEGQIAPASMSIEEPAMGEAPRLNSLSIEPLGVGDNVLLVELNSPRDFTLRRTAPSEYVLRVNQVGLGPDAGTTLLASPGSGVIRSVRPVIQGNDVLLRIFCTPKANLEARSNGSKIVVSTVVSGLGDDMRAQASTEVAANATGANAGQKGGEDLEAGVTALLEEAPKYTGKQISLDLQDTDIDNALRIIAEVSNLNIIASQDVAGKVTLRLIDVPWDQALDVILKTNGLDKVQEGNVVRIAPVEKLRAERESLKQLEQAKDELEPLQVKYIRISYAKASELKPLVEEVLSERGSVAYDERTNQLIVKDIFKGVKNVAELVAKLDLRTPQVLLETQIVEAARGLLRDLGTELGFSYIQSPATGNATGANFPNAISVGGSVDGLGSPAIAFPAGVTAEAGSAVTFLLESADGTKNLGLRLSALEQEGRARVVSRPAVATTNSKRATIKSVTKIRVKTPDGGLSVATGSGASANSSSAVATEQIEVGIVLNVTPQASPDYFVLLDIDAKSSTLGDPAQAVDGIPPEIERSATSSVLVSSGQTFAMGGIYVIRDSDASSGVPFLKDIPFFGYLFRRSAINNSDEELLFFITPRIIEGSFDDAAMRVAS